jgi:DNA polymerase
MKELRAQIKACEKCEGMNIHGVTQAAPGYGSVRSPVVLVGQSLCHNCMESQIPFTGGSGGLIDASLALADVDKRDVFITNVVHCHPHREPRDNRASKPHEIANCTPYLVRELKIVEPELVIGLGNDAKRVLRAKHPGARELSWPFRRPRSIAAMPPDLLLVPHPSAKRRQRNAAPPEDRERIERKYVIELSRALRWSFDAREKRLSGPQRRENHSAR